MGSRPVAWPLSLATKRCRMPKNTYSGSHPATFAQGLSLKNEFSLGTHQAGRVPTWSLYNTHGVAPLRLAPFLGYTGVTHATLVPTVLKNEFSQHTHLRLQGTHMVPTHGVAPPVSGNEVLPDAQKTAILGTHPATFAQGLPKKRVFPGYPPGGYPPPLRLAPFLGYTGVPTWSLYEFSPA